MFYYLITLNIITFFLYMFDKISAIKRKRRISEYCLLTFSVFGGCLGGLIGMYFLHHKTRKWQFILTNWSLVFIWFILLFQEL